MTRLSIGFGILIGMTAACGDNGKSASIVDSTVDFGLTDCGTTAVPRVLVVSNPTGSSFHFTTSLGLGDASPYLVVPDNADVLPDRQLQVMIYSKPIPQTSAVTDNLYGDTLTLSTDSAGDTPHAVALKQTAHGAILSFANPTLTVSGTTPVGAAPANQPVMVQNKGNSSSDVTVTSSGLSFTQTGPAIVIAGGATGTVNVAYTPREIGAVSETLSLAGTGPQCSTTTTAVASGTSTVKGQAAQVALANRRGEPRRAGANNYGMCVLTKSGLVACTGANDSGMRGAGDSVFSSNSFNLVRTKTGVLDQVVQIVGARNFFCARRTAGDIWCWGDYFGIGQKGAFSDPRSSNSFATQAFPAGTRALSAGYANTCVVDATGTVACSGENSGAQLPLGGWTASNAKDVAATGGGGYALLNDGTVLSFGENQRGERGNGGPSEAPPSAVVDGTATPIGNVTQVVIGGGTNSRRNRHGCSLFNDGSLSCWGKNRHGELGTNSGVGSSTPVPGVVQAATLTCLLPDNTTACNPGDANCTCTQNTAAPLAAVTAVSAGRAHTCAIADQVYCWGRGSEGQLGTGLTSQFNVATPTFPAITNATSITARDRVTCATLATGAVRCWGTLLGGNTLSPTAVGAFEP